jgi:hypothetical protein
MASHSFKSSPGGHLTASANVTLVPRLAVGNANNVLSVATERRKACELRTFQRLCQRAAGCARLALRRLLELEFGRLVLVEEIKQRHLRDEKREGRFRENQEKQ